MLNVFERYGETIRHFWGSELFDATTEPGQDTPRGPGRAGLEPVRPHARRTRRADWDEQLSYA